MKSRTPTQRRSEPTEQARLRAVPAAGQPSEIDDCGRGVSARAISGSGGRHPVVGAQTISAAEFSEAVRIVLSVARRLQLETPVFRSPPRAPEVDRTIQRRGSATVIAIRRGSRPLAAIRADIIEGVVVANYLDPEQGTEFRRLCWSALEAGFPLTSVTGGAGSSWNDSTDEGEPRHRQAA